MIAKVWITKYALTEGIKTLTDVEEVDGGYVSKAPERGVGSRWQQFHHFYGAKDWHRTEAEALVRADQMRVAKLATLHKSIKKLEALSFAPPTRSDAAD